ncbi:MAG TPA: metalloregulator ArsR/SmtB family transcription factor [Candidatus Baltobacteraceae bacterium]|nr:metalloregulator ArsR/SmtB family transcription factor [Candidatus Baltobacteraceae bacterium]
MVNNVITLDRVFGALADPTRRRIVERLSRRSLTIGEIAAEFDISQPAISKHVRVLEASGLLQRRIEGRVHHCALSPAAMESASKWLDKQRAYWNASLDRLDAVLANEAKKRK